ncbi:hypothetical protein AB0M43_11175 [Longispora sp. NPDC051575]|uniref:hypothetical protein n=1 Tax=Longispora sp. NPDC051575 TaxID=3154943 RepID=UPI00342C2964
MSRILRTTLAAAFALATTGVSLAASVPAQAYPTCRTKYYLTDDGTYLSAGAYMICDSGDERDIYVRLQRLDPATGSWTTVSSNWNSTSYTCVGTAPNTYRRINDTTSVVATITANCG